MLGVHLAQCSRSLASTSTSSARAASLHTSAILQASARTRKSQRTLKANIQRRQELERQAEQNRPHVVLGHKAGDAAKWLHCDLARVLISEADVRASPAPGVDAATGEVRPPQFANYGVGTREAGLLLETLPEMTVKAGVEFGTLYREMDPKQLLKLGKEAEKEEAAKSAVFARLVDLRNANARGITYENTRRIVATFSEPENPTDTGRPEVQAALATMRIRNLWDHLGRCKKDIANRRSLRRLVHKRAKILRYLKTVDEDRYDRVLERLGLERGAVEGELVV